MAKVEIGTKCNDCGAELKLSVSPEDIAPDVASGLKPVSSILMYRITSEDIKKFITDVSRKHVPGIKVEVVPRYCEKKRNKKNEPHRSYASLRIAFSDKAIEKTDDGWYAKIGEGGSRVPVVESLMKNVINRYRYNRKDIDQWLSSYKNLEELEDTLGMTENFINDIKEYATPRGIPTNSDETWVIFSAAPENVIAHMLEDPNNHHKPIGRIQIQDVYPISKDVVEFLIYVYPSDLTMKEDPIVRKILLGEEKEKK